MATPDNRIPPRSWIFHAPVGALLIASLPVAAQAATTLSQSAIVDCTFEPVGITSRSEVVNGSAMMHRARVIASHYEKNDLWDKIDVANSGWGGTRATVSHDHDFPSGLFTGSDRLRVIATHLYQRCASGFWEIWKEATTKQTGCGLNEV